MGNNFNYSITTGYKMPVVQELLNNSQQQQLNKGKTMKYETILLIALAQFFFMLPTAFYILSLNMPGLFFSIMMLSGMFTIITLYYPLITIHNNKE